MADQVPVWVAPEADADTVSSLSDACGISRPFARLLVSRGIETEAQTKAFLNPDLASLPDPLEHFPGCREAAARIWKAIDGGERITLFADYDVDGVSSAAMALDVLRHLGAKVEAFFPCRQADGYGLRLPGLTRCLEETEPSLIVTLDCGTGGAPAVAEAAKRGIDVVITDHHEVVDVLPDAVALVNPKVHGPEEAREMAGVGVAFRVMQGVLNMGAADGREAVAAVEIERHLDLVALATVADVVALVGENRVLVRAGLERINRSPRVGIRALAQVTGIRTQIDCYHLGFLLGPRINAAGRLGSAQPALELLTCEDAREARFLAGRLNSHNRDRKRIEDGILAEATGQIDDAQHPDEVSGFVVAGDGWHVGAIGIAAARLAGRYRRPTVVVSFGEDGIGRGSCRSVDPVSLVPVMEGCKDLLITCGGHEMSGGVTLERENLDAFRERFEALCREQASPEELCPVVQVDDWIPLREATLTLMDETEKLRPMGLGNPTPLWGARGVRVIGQQSLAGRNHLRMKLTDGETTVEAIAFGQAGRRLPSGEMDIAFQIQMGNSLSRRTVQLNIKDFRSAEE